MTKLESMIFGTFSILFGLCLLGFSILWFNIDESFMAIICVALGGFLFGLGLKQILWSFWKPKIYSKCSSCGKPITKKEAKQFDSQCYGCWYEMCQERTLNEELGK